jgi:hypothetical protein
MRSKYEGDNAVDNQANPEIDEQTEVRDQPSAAMLGSHGQVRHEEEEVDEIPQNYRSEGYEEVPREAHSIL